MDHNLEELSAGDSDASYSDISGATTNPYDYTDAPAQGRYYKCKVTSTGAEDAYSTADRGFKGGSMLLMF